MRLSWNIRRALFDLGSVVRWFSSMFLFLFFWCFLDLLKFERNLDILTLPKAVEHVLERYFPRLFARISWLIIFNFLIFRPERCWVVGWRRRVAAGRRLLCSEPPEKCRTCGTRRRTIPQQVHSDKYGYTRKCFFSRPVSNHIPHMLKYD